MILTNYADTLPPQLVVIGDSNSNAPITPANSTWVAQAAVTELAGWHVSKQTVDGQSLADTLTNYLANVRPLYSAKRARNVLMLFSSYIDLLRRKEIYETATTDGWFVITNTIAGNQYLSDLARQAENPAIRGYFGHAHLVDIAAPEHKFGTLAEAGDTTWFYDGAHPTVAGAKAYKNLIIPKVIGAPYTTGTAVLAGETCVITLPGQTGVAITFEGLTV